MHLRSMYIQKSWMHNLQSPEAEEQTGSDVESTQDEEQHFQMSNSMEMDNKSVLIHFQWAQKVKGSSGISLCVITLFFYSIQIPHSLSLKIPRCC